jgi:hypothetical protein
MPMVSTSPAIEWSQQIYSIVGFGSWRRLVLLFAIALLCCPL